MRFGYNEYQQGSNGSYPPKVTAGFRLPFIQRTHAREHKIKPPKFDLEDVEDYYTYYVLILEIPEDIFWYADYSFLLSVVENKVAYDGWLNYVLERERNSHKKR